MLVPNAFGIQVMAVNTRGEAKTLEHSYYYVGCLIINSESDEEKVSRKTWYFKV